MRYLFQLSRLSILRDKFIFSLLLYQRNYLFNLRFSLLLIYPQWYSRNILRSQLNLFLYHLFTPFGKLLIIIRETVTFANHCCNAWLPLNLLFNFIGIQPEWCILLILNGIDVFIIWSFAPLLRNNCLILF